MTKETYKVGVLDEFSSMASLIKWDQLDLENEIMKTENGNNTKIKVYSLLDVEDLKNSDLVIAGFQPTDRNVVKELRKTNTVARYAIRSGTQLLDAAIEGYSIDLPHEALGSEGLIKLLKSDDFFRSLRNNDDEGFYNSIMDINKYLMSQNADMVIALCNPARGIPKQPAFR